jgi:tyrocidine synthetase-3
MTIPQGVIDYWLQKFDAIDPYRLSEKANPGSLAIDSLSVDLPQLIVQDINKLARNSREGEYVIFLTLFGVLASRYFSLREFLISSSTAKKCAEEALSIFRFRMNQDETFKNAISALGDEYETTCTSPPFNDDIAKYIFSRNPESKQLINQLAFDYCEFDAPQVQSSQPHIELKVRLRNDGSACITVNYQSANFSPEFVRQFIRHYIYLLQTLKTQASKPLKLVEILEAEDLNQLLHLFNDTSTDFHGRTIADVFESQVLLCPDKIAIFFENKSLTYKDLNEQADKVAFYLQEQAKIKSNELVAIMMDRSDAFIISILGILKAGAAYVPIEPSHPAERIKYILDDVKPPVLITQSDYIFGISKFSGHIFCADIQLDTLEKPLARITKNNESSDIAYVMYTSGTAGQPKGVVVENRSVIRLVKDTNYVSLGQEEVLLQTGPLSFDASTFEIWGMLLNGGELHLLPQDKILNTSILKSEIHKRNISIMWMTASWFNQVLDEDVTLFQPLKTLLVGGDKLSVRHINTLRESAPHIQIINGYGPTENTTFSICHKINQNYESDIPLGKPISNSTVYILDEGMLPVPIGVKGEIYVGGEGTARCYLNNQELSNKKFIPNPFSSKGENFFRTGDLGRWNSAGEIEFFGRIDSQVKVRGYRIELAEIENTVIKHGNITRAYAVVRTDEAGEKDIILYYKCDENVPEAAIKEFLKTYLPVYMIPSFIIRIKRFPLTANGKIDERALPDPKKILEQSSRYLPPVTPTETRLAAIWEEVLEMKPIGITHNFFELGGHSLRVFKVFALVYKEMGVQLDTADFFSKPTVREIAAIIDAQKHELFTAIERLPDQEHYGMSHAQLRLWLLQQLDPSSVAYSIPFAFQIEGALDIACFKNTWDDIVERHEILRTNIIVQSDRPRQIIRIGSDIRFKMEVLDLTGSKEHVITNCVNEEANKSFDLVDDSLVRGRLLILAEDRFIFLLTFHHLIFDGWSLEVLVKDLANIYSGYKKGTGNTLKILSIQYRDFAHWQNFQLGNSSIESSKNYWLNQFATLPDALDLPADYVRPALKTYTGKNINFTLPRSLTLSLREFSAAQNSTLFITLMTAVKVLLYKYTGQPDIVVGTPVAGRDRIELEDQIGFYVNTLPVRTKIDAESTFIEMLDKVKSTLFDGYKHQLYPFDKLVDDLKLHRDLSHEPLFDVMVQFLNMNASLDASSHLDDISIKPYERNLSGSKYDLTFTFSEIAEDIILNIEFSDNLFTESRITRTFKHLETLLNCITSELETPLYKMSIIGSDELSLIESFSKSGKNSENSSQFTVLELWDKAVTQFSQNIAVVDDDHAITYKELDIRAGQLAAYLAKHGVTTGITVGIAMNRSKKLVITTLAIFKLGASYLPIDKSNSGKRIRHIVSEADLSVVITDESLSSIDSPCLAVNIDNVLSESVHYPVYQSLKPLQPQDLAYIIYTSGSTGNPKGVMVEQHALANLCLWHVEEFAVTQVSRATVISNIGFDAFTWEVWPYLIAGATLYPVKETIKLDVNLLSVFLTDNRISHTFLATALCELLISSSVGDQLKYLTVLTGGDVLKTDRHPNFKLINNYGPTEATVVSTSYDLEDWDGKGKIPIGKPISNSRLYILDHNFNIQPIGIPGEICIAGSNLARGYLKNESLTREKFVQNSNDPATRMYRTGDFGAWDENGNVRFFGRRDLQVKVRGIRIELGEIEFALESISYVQKAIVCLKSTPKNDTVIVAYIIDEKRKSNGSDIRNKLKDLLPEYMIPVHIISIEKVPLTNNGKVDLKRLPDVDFNTASVNTSGEAFTSTEHKLAVIWQELLGIKIYNKKLNFFEIGGHSLKAFQLMNEIYRAFDVKILLADIFKNTTLEQLAIVIEHSGNSKFQSIQPVPASSNYEVSFAQRRLWILGSQTDEYFGYNVPLAYMLHGKLDVERLKRSFELCIERHEILRTGFVVIHGELKQEVSEASKSRLDFKYLDYSSLQLPDEKIQALAHEEMRKPFNLEVPPLIRVHVIKVSDVAFGLLVTLQHIVCDGWSMGILAGEIFESYNRLKNDSEFRFPCLTIQYRDYTAWQKQYMLSEDAQHDKEFWLNQYTGGFPVSDLQTDFPRTTSKTYNGDSIDFSIDQQKSEKLKKLAQQHNTTLNSIMLSVIQCALYHFTGHKDIVIGTPVAGRNHPDLKNQIGFYVNTLPLRLRLLEDESFATLIDKTHNYLVQALDHQTYPFDQLIEDLNISYVENKSPLFNIMYVYQNLEIFESDFTNRMDGLSIEKIVRTNTTSKFDLTVTCHYSSQQFHLNFEYSKDLFEPATLYLLKEYFQQVMQQLIDNSTIKLKEATVNVMRYNDYSSENIQAIPFDFNYSG